MANDYEIFKGKSLSDLFEDIYKNTERNKTQLEVLMKEVTSFIKDGDTAVQIIPMLKEYLEINVKNDDQLVRWQLSYRESYLLKIKVALKMSLVYRMLKKNNF